ncbi:MAG: hypothetical protein ACRD4R_15730 [Candidatus Acidiferrales bacterium]
MGRVPPKRVLDLEKLLQKLFALPSSRSRGHRCPSFWLAVCLAAAFASALCGSPAARAARAAGDTTKPQSSPAISADPYSPVLESGFGQLYELNFAGARATFLNYQRSHPNDPVGKAAEAASYLYEQFNAKGIFTSRFFLNDDKLLNGADGTPAENRNAPFLRADRETRKMAEAILKSEPHNVRALLALTLADGMESDYDALIVKKQMDSLGLMRRAEREANALLAVDPDEDDAYVALGATDYVIGCLPGYKRAFLWFGGIHGDRVRGMQEMQLAADHGRYLRPFAEILLALACEREHQPRRAHALLAQLTSEFPENKRFARELALLDAHTAGD